MTPSAASRKACGFFFINTKKAATTVTAWHLKSIMVIKSYLCISECFSKYMSLKGRLRMKHTSFMVIL